MDRLQHRYLLGLPRGEGRVFLSWRLLASDRPDTPFYVERQTGDAWQRVTPAPILDSTNLLFPAPEAGAGVYRVVTGEGNPSESVEVDADAPPGLLALDRPLDPDDRIEGLIVGDLCGDGRMGYVLRAARGGTVRLLAFRHDGAALWEFDTRLPARGGWDGSTLHVPFLCWDINADGRAEVVCHRAKAAFPAAEYDTAGPDEWLTALDAETGAVVWDAPWPAKVSRVMMTVGHLHGPDRPADIVVQDETYQDITLAAVSGRTGSISWAAFQPRPGGHNLDIADTDEDGAQEVICGGVCYNGDGTVRWMAESFGHTDISKPAKIVPDLKGLQIWYAVESGNPGVYLVDWDGRTLFKEPFRHAHYGWVARHAPGMPGLHPHAAEDARHEYGAAQAGMRAADHFPIFLPDGSHWLSLTDWQRKNFVPVHWDAGREAVFIVRKENRRVVRLLATGEIEDLPDGKLPEGGQYGRNLACIDVVGDYRENIVTVDTERHRLMVLANPTVSHSRGYSPMDRFDYRHDRSQLGSGYYIYLSPPETVVERRLAS